MSAMARAERRPTTRWLASLLRRTAPRGLIPFVATRGDVDELVQRSEEAFGEQALSHAGVRYYLERGHALVFGLRKRGAIVSYTVCELNDGMGRAYVVETFTAAELRGKGLGSWLRARVEDVALHLGYRHVASHVAVTNTAAQRLNEKAGLTIVRRIRKYYEDGRDGLYLRKTLDPAAPGRASARRRLKGLRTP